jgi:inosine/xanthosine triphosphatase
MPTLDALIASEETKLAAEEINKMREESGLTPLEIHLAPLVMADDSCPISSTRIRNGEIDADGKLQRPLVVNVGTKNKAKIWATRDIFLKVFKKVEIHGVEVEAKVADSPMDDEVREGAINRAKESVEGADFGVGIEGGILTDSEGESGRMVQYCAIADKRGVVTEGQGPAYQLPRSVSDRVRDGIPLIEAERRTLNVDKIEEEDGMAGHVSAGFTNRRELTEISVLMALIPRLKSNLYSELWKQNP